MEIEIHRVSCRACGQIFSGLTSEKAEEEHRLHIKDCETLIALEKVERFREKAEKILGRKLSFLEASKLLGAWK